jgi:biotin/methionine sulfoxide reductase
MEPVEWLGSEKVARFPIHLLSNQPSTRLHSQLDLAPLSRESKISGREPISLTPTDAAARGIRDGDIVHVYNDRGGFIAGAVINEGLVPGVAQIATGAWYDPLECGLPGSLDKHGNPNTVTLNKGTSKLGQSSIAQSVLVQVERYDDVLPPITAYSPPKIVQEEGAG